MRRLLLFLLLAGGLIFPAKGEELFEVPGLDGMYHMAEGYGVEEGADLGQGVTSLFEDALAGAGELLKGSLRAGAKLLGVALLCTLAHGVCPEWGKDGLQVAELAGALAVTALSVSDMTSMIGLGRETISRMDDFSSVLLPVMATLTAATGQVGAAAFRQGATVLFSDLLITAIDRLLVPLVYTYVALCCAHAAVGNEGLKKLADLMKSAVTFALTALLLAFVGYLTASGAIAGTADAAAVKVTKLAISRAVPVVGGILADAAESVLAGAGMLKGTVGMVGLLVVVAICIGPFLQLAFHYLAYKAAGALTGTVADMRLCKLIDSIGTAFGLVLGMTGACALVLLVSLVSAVSAVAA